MKIASHNVIIPVELINNSQGKKVVRKKFRLYLCVRFGGKCTTIREVLSTNNSEVNRTTENLNSGSMYVLASKQKKTAHFNANSIFLF